MGASFEAYVDELVDVFRDVRHFNPVHHAGLPAAHAYFYWLHIVSILEETCGLCVAWALD